jgi:hypothetical protein
MPTELVPAVDAIEPDGKVYQALKVLGEYIVRRSRRAVG